MPAWLGGGGLSRGARGIQRLVHPATASLEERGEAGWELRYQWGTCWGGAGRRTREARRGTSLQVGARRRCPCLLQRRSGHPGARGGRCGGGRPSVPSRSARRALPWSVGFSRHSFHVRLLTWSSQQTLGVVAAARENPVSSSCLRLFICKMQVMLAVPPDRMVCSVQSWQRGDSGTADFRFCSLLSPRGDGVC